MLAAVRRIQNSIHVDDACGEEHGEAFEDLLGRLLESADGHEEDDTDHHAGDHRRPAPSQIVPKCRWFPVFAR